MACLYTICVERWPQWCPLKFHFTTLKYLAIYHRRRKPFDFGGAAGTKVLCMHKSEDASQRCTCMLTGNARNFPGLLDGQRSKKAVDRESRSTYNNYSCTVILNI